MKALSIRQPWAWAIIHAGKDVENRIWPTRYRGRFYVHSAKGMTRDEYDYAIDTIYAAMKEVIPTITANDVLSMVPKFDELDRGGIIGSVELVECLHADQLVGKNTGPWFFGPYGFVLRKPEPLPFRPMRGMLGFFDPENIQPPKVKHVAPDLFTRGTSDA